MKVLVSGSKGMLGTDLMRVLGSSPTAVVGFDLDELDITDRRAVEDRVLAEAPDVLINAAAYTDVDRSEEQEDLAFQVNAEGAANLALACRAARARLVHVSTDYVFDGSDPRPYSEQDRASPLGVYGRSKWEGEERIREILPEACLVRTAWLYGKAGKNFVKAILAQADQKSRLRVVDDQRGSPTYTFDLAMALREAAGQGLEGTYHVTNQGSCSWLEFAVKILELSEKTGVEVDPISSEELGRPAPRPTNSVLSCGKFEEATGMKLRTWQDALADYLSE